MLNMKGPPGQFAGDIKLFKLLMQEIGEE